MRQGFAWLAACALAASGLVASAPPAGAAPADRDRAFGDRGIVRVEGPGGPAFSPESSARMAIGPDGEIFVLYESIPACAGSAQECRVELGLLRYDSNGHRDTSFGTGPGSVLVVHQAPLEQSFALAVGPDGKPVVAAADRGGPGAVLARFDVNGSLDPTFGENGVVQGIPNGYGGSALAVQLDGKILVGAEGGPGLDLSRYLPSGALDPSFGEGGRTTVALATRGRPAGLAVDPVGDISVASPQCCGGSGLFGNGISLTRFLPGGSLDPQFNGGQPLLYPTPGAQGTVEAAAMAPHGAVVVSFEEEMGTRATVGNAIKVLPDGSLDPKFGHAGRISIPARVGAITPHALAVDSTGRIVGFGWDGSVAVFRLLSNGAPDRTFDAGQRVLVPFGGSQEAPLAIGLQPSGRIVALAETSCCGPKAFALIGLRGGTDRTTRCLGRRATIVGTGGPDEIAGTPHRDVIAGLGGKDTVKGLGGPDLICGGKGRDKIYGGPGRDLVKQ